MYCKKVLSLFAILVIAFSAVLVQATEKNEKKNETDRTVIEPLNLAVLIQDDLVSQVSNELGVTREFIRSLPKGSRVMVGYITAGTLQVRQPFTTELEKASSSSRIPTSSTSSSPFNPYVEVKEALGK